MRSQPQPAADIQACLSGVIEGFENLIDSHDTRALIEAYVREHGGYFNSANVTQAIEANRDKLKWRPVEPKPPKRAILAQAEVQNRVFAELAAEFPWFPASRNNVHKIFDFLWQHQVDFTRDNVRIAIQNLEHQRQLEHIVVLPRAPVIPEAPAESPEVLGKCSDGKPQLSLRTTNEWHLRNASIAQLKDFRDRARKSA
jgi:hypothetical protein